MSLEELIISAKELANSLKDDELKADLLINQTKNTHNQIEAMKKYSEDVEKLNEAASQRPYSVLVAGLQRESQHLRELQAENCELRNALADHQNAIELIMSKYRQQISQLLPKEKTNFYTTPNLWQCNKIIQEQSTQINEMKQIMREAAKVDEENAVKDQELISKLMTENKGLRDLLYIHRTYGPFIEMMENDEKNNDKNEEKNENKS